MASYTIPEDVIGVPLFVPDAYDQFSIVVGGMPNGDDCLRVRGDLASDYKAFQPAGTTTPDIAANLTSWAVTCWVKAPSSGGSLSFGRPGNSVLFGIMNADNGTDNPNLNCIMSLSAVSGGAYDFSRSITSSGSQEFRTTASSVRDGNWHMITVNVPDVSQTGAFFVDDNNVASSSDTQTGGSQPAGNLFFSLGAYSDAAPSLCNGFNQDYQIGKLAFHDHHLSQTERSMLYQSMVG